MIQIAARAKINFLLHVLEKRGDGYHTLDSLFLPIELADAVTVELGGDGIRLVCDDPSLPAGENNLMVRAATAFSRHTGQQTGVRMSLAKHIPAGAGLGGGSSDAAAVLRALDTLTDTRLDARELGTIAAGIGSDVPFFLHGTPAHCTGRGERVVPAPGIPALDLLLVKPPFGIETGAAYTALDKQRRHATNADPIDSIDSPKSTLPDNPPLPDLPCAPHNDFEAPVFEKYLLLPVIKKWLTAQPETRTAMMSGSGSTLFAVTASRAAAMGLRKRAEAEFGETLWMTVTRSIPSV